MKVSDCMSREVRVAAIDNTMQSAAQIMADLDAGFLPISDNDRLVGVVTDRDIAIRGVAAGKPPETPVSEVMSAEVRYCFDDDPVQDVLDNMGDIQVRRLPVVNRDKKLVGIISISDLASAGAPDDAGLALKDITRPSGLHSQVA